MIIIFGKRSFKLKELSFSEIGFPEPEENMKIEGRQDFVHIFFIPFFPIGKRWLIRRADNQLYCTTKQIDEQIAIKEIELKNSPWAFTGLMIAGAVLLYGLLTSMF